MTNIFKSKPFMGIAIVFLIALIMRFWQLTKYPVHFSMDEAAIGFNAYSVLNTGRDEHGKTLPLAFESVGDFKPPVNVYLTVVSEAIFGYNEGAVRGVSALMGSLTVIVFILFLKKLKLGWTASIFGGFWLSILPWHVHFSRGGFEAVTALFFLVAGAWLFLKWLEEKKLSSLILSISFFSLSVWAYHAERFFVPIFVLFLIIFFYREVKLKTLSVKKQVGIGIVVFLFFAIPFVNLAFFTPAIAQRAAVTSILRETSLNQSLHGVYTGIVQQIFDNNNFIIFRHWAGKYLNYYDLRFWFWEGLQFTQPGYPDLGLMYALDLPLFLFGIYSLVKSDNKKLKAISIFWFFAGPLPASFAMNEQHPLRALTWLPFFGIVIASGVNELILNFGKWKKLAVLYGILILGSVIYFGDIYMHQFPWFYAESWQYGYREVSKIACKNLDNYDKIYISDTFGSLGPLNTGVPPLYVLFYCPADRENYLATGEHLSKIQFRRPNRDVMTEKGNLLLIGSPWDFLDGNLYRGKIIEKVIYPSGIDAFWIVERPKQ